MACTRVWYIGLPLNCERTRISIGSFHSLVGENPKQWEVMAAQAEFAYNYSKNQTIGKSPFEVIYGKQPMHLYDLAPLPEIGRNSFKSENMADLIFFDE